MSIVRMVLSMVMVAVLAASPCMAAEADSGEMSEINQMLKAHGQAFDNKDIDAVMGMYSPEAVLMGTGPGERYEGAEEIKEAHRHFFESFDKQTSELTWHKFGVKGDVAWGMAMKHYTAYNKNVKNEYALNWSAVLEKQNGKWVFVSVHFSNLVCK